MSNQITSAVRDDKDILEMFENRFTSSSDIHNRIRDTWQADNDFSLGNQWDPESLAQRSIQGAERPCLTINKADPLVMRLVNDARQKKLSNKVIPLDDMGDRDTAYIFSGILRNFEYRSNAIRSYMWAYECAMRGGIGAVKVLPDYEDDSFDQTVRISRIREPLTVYFDPDAEERTAKDGNWVIEAADISQVAADTLVKDSGKEIPGYLPNKTVWTTGSDTVRYGQVWWFEEEKDEIWLLKDKSSVRKSLLTKSVQDVYLNIPGMIIKRRSSPSRAQRYAKICGGNVLQSTAVNGKYPPIVRFVGREGYINKELDFRGVVRNMKDSNKMYNVMSSLIVERIGLSPKSPWLMAAGQAEGYEDQWLNANMSNLPKLEYNPMSLNGVPLPPPQRTDVASGDPSVERYLAISSQDIKDTSQISDAFLGNKTNMTSGAGVKALSAQSDTATFDFFDSCCESIEHCGRIQLDLAQILLSDRQVIQIMGEDMSQKVIDLGAFQNEQGEVKKISLDVGKYDTELEIATGDKTRRETAIEQLTFVMQTNPPAANLVMDVLVANLDIKDADKISKRFKAMLPPQALAAEAEGEKANPEVEALHQHAEQIITQLKQNLDQCTAALQQCQKDLADKTRDLDIKAKQVDNDFKIAQEANDIKKLEVEAKDNIVATKTSDNGSTVVKTTTKANGGSQIEMLQEEIDGLHKQMEMVIHIAAQLKMKDADQESVLQHLTQNAAQDTASEGPAQPQGDMTAGNGAPPTESENVGGPNG